MYVSLSSLHHELKRTNLRTDPNPAFLSFFFTKILSVFFFFFFFLNMEESRLLFLTRNFLLLSVDFAHILQSMIWSMIFTHIMHSFMASNPSFAIVIRWQTEKERLFVSEAIYTLRISQTSGYFFYLLFS